MNKAESIYLKHYLIKDYWWKGKFINLDGKQRIRQALLLDLGSQGFRFILVSSEKFRDYRIKGYPYDKLAIYDVFRRDKAHATPVT